MKIKALMIAAALLAAADVHAAPQKAKTASAKAAKAAKAAKVAKVAKVAATAQKEAAPAQQQGGIRFSDGIAAVADNEVITRRRLAEAVAEAKANLPKDAQISESELSRQVLMQLVNQSLIVQAGKRRNIQASEAEIDAVVAKNSALKNPQPRPTPRFCRQHHCRKSPPAGSDAEQPRERS
ncbi:rotamase [Neisseria meningitidis]|nr:rotamase [Neisseria meningitidis]